MVNHGPTVLNRKFQKQTVRVFTCEPFWVTWWNLVPSCSILPQAWAILVPRCPGCTTNHPLVTERLSYQMNGCTTAVQLPLIYSIVGPRDAGSPDIPLLCLICKLNFILDTYAWEKHSMYRVWYEPWFLGSHGGGEGGLGMCPPQTRGAYCTWCVCGCVCVCVSSLHTYERTPVK